MGWLSMGTPNPSPSTAGCLVLPEQGRIHPLGYQRAEPQNAAKKRMLGGNHLLERPHSHLLWGITWLPGHQHLHRPMEELWTPHPYPHPTYAHTHPLIFPLPHTKQGSPHTRSTPSLLLPPKTPQPGRARAHLLSGSPVCLPKVFAAGGTCFDTISSAKEAAHLA